MEGCLLLLAPQLSSGMALGFILLPPLSKDEGGREGRSREGERLGAC